MGDDERITCFKLQYYNITISNENQKILKKNSVGVVVVEPDTDTELRLRR